MQCSRGRNQAREEHQAFTAGHQTTLQAAAGQRGGPREARQRTAEPRRQGLHAPPGAGRKVGVHRVWVRSWGPVRTCETKYTKAGTREAVI